MESKDERLLKAIFDSDKEKDDYPDTTIEKVGYAEYVITNTMQYLPRTIHRLSRLHRLLMLEEKNSENKLADAITNNELRMALEPLLQAENDVKEITAMLKELYRDTTAVEWIDDACTGESVHDIDKLCGSILNGTAIEKAAEEVPDKPVNIAIVDENEAVENEAAEKLHGETIADKCESCRYNTGDYVCHPHCSGCNGRSKFESAQDKPCRSVYEMARDAIVEIERMAGGMVADRIEIKAVENRISAAVRDEECNEVTFSRRLEE